MKDENQNNNQDAIKTKKSPNLALQQYHPV